jgi:hypothetical protein
MAVLLPAILRDWRGFFMLGDHVLERVAVFLDYQNVHLTAHGLCWPAQAPQEKGVDVALAVDLIETALLSSYDVGIVFSGDTDLLPAIEVAFRRTPPHIEIACWRGARPLWFPDGLAANPPRYLPYCHFLDKDDFEATLDPGREDHRR